MTSVRISISDRVLGDVTVDEDDGLGSFDLDRQRAVIRGLLERANAKVQRAYEL